MTARGRCTIITRVSSVHLTNGLTVFSSGRKVGVQCLNLALVELNQPCGVLGRRCGLRESCGILSLICSAKVAYAAKMACTKQGIGFTFLCQKFAPKFVKLWLSGCETRIHSVLGRKAFLFAKITLAWKSQGNEIGPQCNSVVMKSCFSVVFANGDFLPFAA